MARLPGSCARTLGWKISSTSPMARCTCNSLPSLETMPGFLAAMLKRVQTEVGEIGRFRVAEDAEDTTLVVEMIVGESEFLAHFAVSARSREWTQTSRK